jgi:cytochrome c-type biogenesis protein CcmE
MHPLRRKRLITLIVISLTVMVIVGLVLYALKQNINLYFTPSQISEHQAPINKTLRVGGMVKKGSLVFAKKTLSVSFVLTDFHHEVAVTYDGVLPDLFREGQGVVTEGQLNEQGNFIAQQVLAKHDEKYMPPEIRNLSKK